VLIILLVYLSHNPTLYPCWLKWSKIWPSVTWYWCYSIFYIRPYNFTPKSFKIFFSESTCFNYTKIMVRIILALSHFRNISCPISKIAHITRNSLKYPKLLYFKLQWTEMLTVVTCQWVVHYIIWSCHWSFFYSNAS